MSPFIEAVLPHLIPWLGNQKTSYLLSFFNEDCAVQNVESIATAVKHLSIEPQEGDVRAILQHVMDEIDRRIPVPVG